MNLAKKLGLYGFFFLIGMLLFSTTGCSLNEKKASSDIGKEKTLRLITIFSANTLDPHRVDNSMILNSGTMETLVGLDAKTGKLYPLLAEGWTSEDGQNWVFIIRKEVKFHNGNLVTPEAVKASLEHSMKVNPGMRASLKIASMDVVDGTLKIKTDIPYPALPSELVHHNAVIIDVTVPNNQIPIGTGPFKFIKFDLVNDTVVERFSDYWNGQAKLDKAVIKTNADANARFLALQAGDVDVVYRPSIEALELLKGKDNVVIEKMPGTRVYNLLYNYAGKNKELWNNEEFRKGIDSLVDRRAIVDNVMNKYAVVAYSPFPGTYPFSPESKDHEYSISKALMHFQAAGLLVKDGKVFYPDGKPINLLLATYIARPELPQIAQIFQDAAKNVGINVQVDVVENINEFLLKGDWDLATYSILTVTRGDGAYYLNSSFTDKGMNNFGKFYDKQIDDLILAFNKTVDQNERYALTKQIGTLIEEKAYNCYILSPYEIVVYHKSVKGWLTTSNEVEFPMITKDLDIVNE